jgi:hypothetical protein
VYGNKIDLPHAMDISDAAERLELNKVCCTPFIQQKRQPVGHLTVANCFAGDGQEVAPAGMLCRLTAGAVRRAQLACLCLNPLFSHWGGRPGCSHQSKTSPIIRSSRSYPMCFTCGVTRIEELRVGPPVVELGPPEVCDRSCGLQQGGREGRPTNTEMPQIP